jgi:hypothetical protein
LAGKSEEEADILHLFEGERSFVDLFDGIRSK